MLLFSGSTILLTAVSSGRRIAFALRCRHRKQQGAEHWSQKSPQGCHRDGIPALLAPVCCIISSDPTIAMESQRSFLNFVITDQQLRSHLLSEAGMQLGAKGGGFFAAACTDHPLTYPGAAGPIDISHDQSLSGILERLRETRRLPGGEERCLPRVGTDCASQVRASNNMHTHIRR